MPDDSKLSELTAATNADSAQVQILQGGANKRLAVGQAITMGKATEKDVLAGTSDSLVLTPLSLKDKLDEFDKELGVHYGPWAEGTDFTLGVGTTNVTIPNVGSTQRKNSSSFDIRTGAVPANQFLFAGTTCAGFPNSGFNGTFQGGIIFDDGDGLRWLIPAGHPQIENLASPADEVIFYYENSAWHQQTYNGDRLRPSITSCPDDNDWWPISSLTHDEPSGNTFQDEFLIAKRNGDQNTVLRLWYDSNANPNTAKVRTAIRAYETGRVTRTTLATHTGQGLSVVNSNQTLPNSGNFTNYDAIMIEACVDSLSDVCYVSPMYMREYLTSNTNTEMIVIRYDANQYLHASIQSDTTYKINARVGLNLKSIIGINF